LSTHHILRQIFEIGYFSQPDAYRLQDTFSNLQRNKLSAIIEQVLEKTGAEFDAVRINQLEVDLGDIAPADIDLLLPIRLEEALRDALYLSIRRAEFDPNVEVIRLDESRSRWDFLLNYLQSGTLRWSADVADINELKKWITGNGAAISQEWRQELKALLRTTRARERLVELIGNTTPEVGLQLLLPEAESEVWKTWQSYLQQTVYNGEEITPFIKQRLTRQFLKEMMVVWSENRKAKLNPAEITRTAIERTEDLLHDTEGPLNERLSASGTVSLAQAISHYLYYGYWPARANIPQQQAIMAIIRQAISQNPEALKAALTRSFRFNIARRRIAYQFAPEQWAEIAAVVSPAVAEQVAGLVVMQQELKGTADMLPFIRAVFIELLDMVAESPALALNKAQIQMVAAKYRTLLQAVANQPGIKTFLQRVKTEPRSFGVLTAQLQQGGFGVLEAVAKVLDEMSPKRLLQSEGSDPWSKPASSENIPAKIQATDNEQMDKIYKTPFNTPKPPEKDLAPQKTLEETEDEEAEITRFTPREFASVFELVRYFLRTGIWPVLTEQNIASLSNTLSLNDPFVLIEQLLAESQPGSGGRLLAVIYPLLRSERILSRITGQLEESLQMKLASEFISLQPSLNEVRQFQEDITSWLNTGKASWEKLLSPKAFTFLSRTAISSEPLIFPADLLPVLARSLRMAVFRLIYEDRAEQQVQQMMQHWIEYAAILTGQSESAIAAIISELANEAPLPTPLQMALQTIARRYASFRRREEAIKEEIKLMPWDEGFVEKEEMAAIRQKDIPADEQPGIDEEPTVIVESADRAISEGKAEQDALAADTTNTDVTSGGNDFAVTESDSLSGKSDIPKAEEPMLPANSVTGENEIQSADLDKKSEIPGSTSDSEISEKPDTKETPDALTSNADPEATDNASISEEAIIGDNKQTLPQNSAQVVPPDNDSHIEERGFVEDSSTQRYRPSEESFLPVLDLLDMPEFNTERLSHRTLKEKLNIPEPKRTKGEIAAEPDKPRREEPPLAEPEEDVIFVENAGVVLIWPYLALCFKNLGYTQQGAFRTPELASRAVHLLQYMATGEEQPPEHLLPLNKLLCGIPIFEVVERDIILTLREKEEAQALLEAVVQHWEKMKNFSVDALRESFLKRHGKLSPGDVSWSLKVEPAGFDILMDTLPWKLGMVKFKWMEKLLIVEWR
jgi:hypothetical protein